MDRPDLEVRIAADPAEVPRLLDILEDYAGKADLPRRAANRLTVVCEELAANVAGHGATGSRGASYVAVALRRRGLALQVVVEDNGPPFDPLGHASPDTGEPLDTRQAGGLGVHLVRTLANGLSYARSGQLNRLRFMIDLGD